MPRIRSIKPDFFASEDVSALPLRARLTWIGLWTQCDDHGRTKRNAKLIKAAIWPLDDISLRDVEEDLQVLADAGRIVRYDDGPTQLLAVVNWHVHQSINKPSGARYLGPPTPLGALAPTDSHYCADCALPGQTTWTTGTLPEVAGNGHVPLPLGREGNGREGTRAREAVPEPPDRCPKHEGAAKPPPCGPCKDARRGHEQWASERSERFRTAAKCRLHVGQLADNCGICRSEELAPP